MDRSAEEQRGYTRRLAVSACAALCLHVCLTLLPLPGLRGPLAPHEGAGGGASSALLSRFLDGALRGAEVTVLQPEPAIPAPAAAPAPAQPETPVPEPPIEPDLARLEVELIEDSLPVYEPDRPALETAAQGSGDSGVTAVAARDGVDAHAGGQAGDTETWGGGGGGEPLEMPLRPRVLVHPHVPRKVVRKRKIDDFVLLQVLVGTDGGVRQVRVLRSIADCQECTQNAVEAARQYRYNPPMFEGRLVEVWTTPFDLRFSYRR
ncbi:MAG: energy transducer TonB [Candidatus Krumholzibacteriia bacterium]